MRNANSNKGAVMVEASIYVPVVLCVVMMLMYYGLFSMQKYMLSYEAERVAIIIAREEAYLGYEVFGMGVNDQIDFDWGESHQPSTDQVISYYKKYNENLSNIYREIGRIISAIGWKNSEPASEVRLANSGRQAVLLAIGTVSDPDIKVERGVFGSKVVVTFTHSLPTPVVLKYLGLAEKMQLSSCAYSYSVNGTSMVRNVDFAVDLVKYILDKFGVGDKVNDFVGKMNSVLDVIL